MDEEKNVFRHNNVVVRIHGGQPDRAVLEKALEKFMAAVEAAKRADPASGAPAGDMGVA